MKLFVIAKKDLAALFADRKALLTLLATPLILTLVLGMALGSMWGSDMPPSIVLFSNQDEGELGDILFNDVFSSPELAERLELIDMKEDVEEARKQVQRGDATVYVQIPSDFSDKVFRGDNTEIEIIGDPGSSIRVHIIESVVSAFAAELSARQVIYMSIMDIVSNMASVAMPGLESMPESESALNWDSEPGLMSETEPIPDLSPEGEIASPEEMHAPDVMDEVLGNININVEEVLENTVIKMSVRDGFQREKDENVRNPVAMDYYAAGMGVMYLLFTVTLGAQRFIQERKDRTLARMLQSPTSRWQITGGKFLGMFLIGAVQISIVIIAGNLLFRVNWGNLSGVVLLAGACVMAASGIGLLIASLAKTSEAADAMGTFITLSMSALGGSMIPLFAMPDWMQNLTRITVNSWAMDGFSKLMFAGAGPSDILLNIGVLAAAGIVLSIFAGTRMARD